MKQQIFKLLLLAFSALIITNCEKDDEFISPKTSYINTAPKVQKTSIVDIKNNENLNASILDIENQFDYKKKDKNQPQTNYSAIQSNDNTFVILTDEILKTTTENAETYTFRIETPTNAESLFENFVIQVIESDILFYIYRYTNNVNLDGLNNSPYNIYREQVSSNQINIGDFDDIINTVVLYDSSSDCYIHVGSSNGNLVITILSCGNNDNGSVPGLGGGNCSCGTLYSPWYETIDSQGNCIVKRDIQVPGVENMVEERISIPCGSDGISPNYSPNFPWTTDSSYPPNYDALHSDTYLSGGGNSNTSNTNINTSNDSFTTTATLEPTLSIDAQVIIDCLGDAISEGVVRQLTSK